jgi:citrate synthase
MSFFDDIDVAPMTTSIGHSTVDDIWVQGYDLSQELMGVVDFGSMFYLLVQGRLPSEAEAIILNAALVALADHGLSPSALAARLTYTGAPEAVQGAVAAGILGGGSVFLGVFEDAGRVVQAANPSPQASDEELDRLADEVLDDFAHEGRRVPGIGHPIHKNGDPRTARLLDLADRHGVLGPHTRLMVRIQQRAELRSTKTLPLNAAGACGAVLSDLGLDARILRGVAVVSRAAGLVGHLAEEIRAPMGRSLWYLAEKHAGYQPRREGIAR